LTPKGIDGGHQAALFGVTQKPDPETLKALNKNITDEFRANAGKVGGRFAGDGTPLTGPVAPGPMVWAGDMRVEAE
jgi:hypothetical protein